MRDAWQAVTSQVDVVDAEMRFERVIRMCVDDDGQILMRSFGASLPYGYEYLGTPQRLVLTTGEQQRLQSLAMAAHHGFSGYVVASFFRFSSLFLSLVFDSPISRDASSYDVSHERRLVEKASASSLQSSSSLDSALDSVASSCAMIEQTVRRWHVSSRVSSSPVHGCVSRTWIT